MNLKWLERARQEDPKGTYCSHCERINLNFDDCGFWYQTDDTYPLEGYRALCSECFDWSRYHGER